MRRSARTDSRTASHERHQHGLLWHLLSTQGADFGLKVLAALAAWIVGRWLIALGLKLFSSALKRGAKVDATLAHYLRAILRVALNIGLVLAILDIFGVKTTSFAALLAGAGLAVGTAWGGMLTHFAAGVFMQLQRSFKVGDYVTAGSVTGWVRRSGSSPPPWSRWRTCAPSLATTPSSMA